MPHCPSLPLHHEQKGRGGVHARGGRDARAHVSVQKQKLMLLPTPRQGAHARKEPAWGVIRPFFIERGQEEMALPPRRAARSTAEGISGRAGASPYEMLVSAHELCTSVSPTDQEQLDAGLGDREGVQGMHPGWDRDRDKASHRSEDPEPVSAQTAIQSRRDRGTERSTNQDRGAPCMVRTQRHLHKRGPETASPS